MSSVSYPDLNGPKGMTLPEFRSKALSYVIALLVASEGKKGTSRRKLLSSGDDVNHCYGKGRNQEEVGCFQ
jgi:hypothetical protein